MQGRSWATLSVTYAEEVLAGHSDAKQSSKKLRDSLQELANALWEAKEQKPIVILIRRTGQVPTKAIELLDTAKHIFGVDRVVFVLAVNRPELAHSVKALTETNLMQKAICDDSLTSTFGCLPLTANAFIRDMLASTGVIEFLENARDPIAKKHSNQLVSR